MQNHPYTYCASCNAGSENALKNDLVRQLPGAFILHPVFDREELKDGRWIVKTRPLLPGYVFVYARQPIEPHEFYRCLRINRLLGYTEQAHSVYALAGEDLAFAEWILLYEGHIGVSRAMLVGDKTQIIDGPLKRYEGEILKIDRRRHRALVAINVGEMAKNIWLGFHWMTLKDGTIFDWERNAQ